MDPEAIREWAGQGQATRGIRSGTVPTTKECSGGEIRLLACVANTGVGARSVVALIVRPMPIQARKC